MPIFAFRPPTPSRNFVLQAIAAELRTRAQSWLRLANELEQRDFADDADIEATLPFVVEAKDFIERVEIELADSASKARQLDPPRDGDCVEGGMGIC